MISNNHIRYEKKNVKFIKSEKSGGRDTSGKRYQRYSWIIDNDKISSCSKKNISCEVKKFIESSSLRPAKVGYDQNDNIVELYLFDGSHYVQIDNDIIPSLKGGSFTFAPNIPTDKPNQTQVSKNAEALDNDISDLENMVKSLRERFSNKIEPKPPVVKSSASNEEKKEAVSKFIKLIYDNKFEIISKYLDGSGIKVNVRPNGEIYILAEILKNSEFANKVDEIVQSRNKKSIKVDSVDSELLFVRFINIILEKLKLDSRVEVDSNHYSGMGDDGDIRFAGFRIDVKIRQKYRQNTFTNLLINEETLSKGFNYFVYCIREGDNERLGEDRRVAVVGYITAEQANNGKKTFITPRGRSNGHWCRQFTLMEIRPINDLICDIVLTLLKEEIV